MVLTFRGQVKPTARIKIFEDGTDTDPSIAFHSAQNTGLFLANTDTSSMGIASNGVAALEITSTAVLPLDNEVYDLGSDERRFGSLYLSGNTLHLGNVVLKDEDGSLTSSAQLIGDGSGLSNLVAANINGLTQALDVIQASSIDANVANITGTVTASSFVGNGSSLTGVVLPLIINSVQITDANWVPIDDTALGLDGGYIQVDGTGFGPATLVVIGTTNASSTTYVSSSVLRCTLPAKARGTYSLSVIRADSAVASFPTGITYSDTVTWTTASNLGSVVLGESFTYQLDATSDSVVTYSNSSALPPQTSLDPVTGNLAGNITSVESSTLYSFDILARDEELQESIRTFLLQLITLLLNATQYTDASWVPLTQTALDSNVSSVYWTIDGQGMNQVTDVVVDGTSATSFTVVDDSTLRVQGPQKPRGTYDVTVQTAATSKVLANAVFFSDVPTWVTPTALGNVEEGVPFSFPLEAVSDSSVSYANVDALPPSTTLHPTTGVLAGTITGVVDDTVYSVGIRATDQELQNAVRSFQFQYLLLYKIISMTGGDGSSIVLTRLGPASFGYNQFGGLGFTTNSGTSNPNPTPISITNRFGGKTIVQLACGAYHTVAVTSDNSVFAFGQNRFGEIGTLANLNNPNPTPVDITNQFAGKSIIKVSCGRHHTIALASDGTVFGFGYNALGQLTGTDSANGTNPPTSIPGHLFGNKTIVDVECGGYHTIVRASDGTLFSFGHNDHGQLCNLASANNPTPTDITSNFGGKSITKVSCGEFTTIAIASDGTLFAAGRNYYGELGFVPNNGTNNPNSTPIDISNRVGYKSIIQVASGYQHTIALASDGSVFTFGFNLYGQLGTSTNSGTSNANPTPIDITSVFSGKTIIQVGSGYFHTMALADDGTMYAFGMNYYGMLATSTNNNTTTPNSTPFEISAVVRAAF